SDKMIVMENKATSTQENFEYTKKLIQTPNPKIIVVTSNFHLYRAKFYAKQNGFITYSAGASIPLSIVPLTHIREILAVGYMLVKNGMSTSF
ncbi:MAG TPA: YdcF family protein, partial [Pseudoneobacillus sp.]|nr:YdcF family protein [Pseudoneobacillus sp.]